MGRRDETTRQREQWIAINHEQKRLHGFEGFDRSMCLREIAHFEQLIARITARGVTTQAQRDALHVATVRLQDERNALALLDRLEAR